MLGITKTGKNLMNNILAKKHYSLISVRHVEQNFENSKPTEKLSLTHLMLLTFFYTPRKHHKIFGFVMFSWL